MRLNSALVLLAIHVLLIGCTQHVKPEKFDIDYNQIVKIQPGSPVKILVPDNSEKEYNVEFLGKGSSGVKIIVDINDMNWVTKEHVEDILNKYNILIDEGSNRYLRITIDRIQWEYWAGGFSVGAFMDFTVETSGGYKKQHRVQDGSAVGVHRAIGGLASRAAEKIFQDPEVISFIQKKEI